MHVTPLAKQAAFWMMPHKGLTGGALWKDFVGTGNAAKGAEYDIFEGNVAFTEKYATNIHWDGYGKFHKSKGQFVWTWMNGRQTLHTTPIEFHTYGFNWTKDKIEFYYDGVLKRTERSPIVIAHVPQYMIVSGGIFDDGWISGSMKTAPWPDHMKVDYVRAWKHV